MSYHGKLQTLKNGTADAEIQQWAYQQLEKETVELTDEEMDDIIHGVVAHAFIVAIDTNSIDAPKLYRDIGRAILRKAQEK